MHITLIKNWTNYIESQISDDDRWFIQNERRFGYYKYKPNLLIFVLCNLAGIAFYLWSLTYFWFFNVHSILTTVLSISYNVIQIIVFIILWRIYYKIPSFADVFYVKGELFWLLIALSCVLLSNLIANSVWYFAVYVGGRQTYLNYAMQIIETISKFISIMVCTKVV